MWFRFQFSHFQLVKTEILDWQQNQTILRIRSVTGLVPVSILRVESELEHRF